MSKNSNLSCGYRHWCWFWKKGLIGVEIAVRDLERTLSSSQISFLRGRGFNISKSANFQQRSPRWGRWPASWFASKNLYLFNFWLNQQRNYVCFWKVPTTLCVTPRFTAWTQKTRGCQKIGRVYGEWPYRHVVARDHFACKGPWNKKLSLAHHRKGRSWTQDPSPA